MNAQELLKRYAAGERVFSNADLRGTDLRETILRGIVLRGAVLEKANLGWANLAEADLSGANLKGAKLNATHLRAANLSSADLSDVNSSARDCGKPISPVRLFAVQFWLAHNCKMLACAVRISQGTTRRRRFHRRGCD